MAAPINPVMEALLAEAATQVLCAPHGSKEAIYADLARRTALSIATIKRHIAARLRGLKPRKRRSDRGHSRLSIQDAQTISAWFRETTRANGKQLADLEAAVDKLDADKKISIRWVDESSGEIRRLSVSAIARAMRHYGCHPAQLIQPAPKVELRSDHPNHCWQIDPSLCVLYYLRRQDGLHAMPRDQFYKNKPRNLAKIEQERVWRYVIVDHTTGAFYVEYVLGAESGENLCSTFINAMQPRGIHDPFHGVPLLAMLDPGSANTGAMFRNLCAVLGVRVWINQPGQPWAKGSVEKHNDIIEREFEHRLKFYHVASLADLNASAWNWAVHFQSHVAHTRHRMTRFAAWQRIRPEQLRVPPSVQVCRQLASHAPQERRVTALLRVSFRGQQYDVRDVPDVIVGQKLLIARNAWADEDTAHVLGTDEHGQPTHYVVSGCERGEYGFTNAAVPLGEYHPHKDTRADTHRKQIERMVMGAATDAEAAAKRKAGVLPFEGTINPHLPEAPQVAYIPRRGMPLQIDAPHVVDLTVPRIEWPEPKREFPPLDHYEAVRRVKPLLSHRGLAWSASMLEDTQRRYPQGMPYEDVEVWAEELWQRYRLRVVPDVQEGVA